METQNHKNGFSLVELSVVLIILALIIGGILSGKHLLRAAQTRTVMTEVNEFRIATQTFHDKYDAMPGDMLDATDYWGEAHTNSVTCRSTASTGTETCNGNGDGKVDESRGEQFRYWQHLSNAALISGNYTGVAGYQSYRHSIIGENIPKAGSLKSGYSFLHSSGYIATWWPSAIGHMYQAGYKEADWDNNPWAAFLTTHEAHAIDKKFDDGHPAYGIILTPNKASLGNCTTTSDHTTTAYNLTFSDEACALQVLYKQ